MYDIDGMYEMYTYGMYEHVLSISHRKLFSTYDEVLAYTKRKRSTPTERIYLACAYPDRAVCPP